MIQLIIASALWSLSFGIIKHPLAGVDASFLALARLFIAFIVFIPFLKLKGISVRKAFSLFITGAVQYGFMYLFYIKSFSYLQAAQVALFTVFTPIYVIFLDSWREKRFNGRFFSAALLACIGCVYTLNFSAGNIYGFTLVQLSNLCFAFGQIEYRKTMAALPGKKDTDIFGLLYAGGFAAVAATALFLPIPLPAISLRQAVFILYLGAVPTALCFFLWGMGSRKVNSGALAALNNLKIPLAAGFAIFIFGEQVPLLRFAAGLLAVTAAAFLAQSVEKQKHPINR